MVNGIHVDILSEVGFDACNAHIQQIFQQAFIPFNSFRIGKVNRSCIIECREIRTSLFPGVL